MPTPSRFGWASLLASAARTQAPRSLGVCEGICGGHGEVNIQLPRRTQGGPGGAGAAIPTPTPGSSAGLRSKAPELLTKLTGTTEQCSLEDMICRISYLVLILLLPFKYRRNERRIKIPSFLPMSWSCVTAFLKIQGLVLPAANWEPWWAPHAELDTQRGKMFSKIICQNNHSPRDPNTMESAPQDFTENTAASAGAWRISKNPHY